MKAAHGLGQAQPTAPWVYVQMHAHNLYFTSDYSVRE